MPLLERNPEKIRLIYRYPIKDLPEQHKRPHVDFDDFGFDSVNRKYEVQMCKRCLSRHSATLTAASAGIKEFFAHGINHAGWCSVDGCNNKSESFVSFDEADVTYIAYAKDIVEALNAYGVAEEALDDEDLCAAVYHKAKAEQDAYRAELLKKSPAEILNFAYEYAMREDILCRLEEYEFAPEDARALLGVENIMQHILYVFENAELSHMDEVDDAIEDCAGQMPEVDEEYGNNIARLILKENNCF